MLATVGCPVYTDYFVRGTEPTVYCDVHRLPAVLADATRPFGIIDKPAPSRVDATIPPVAEASMGSMQRIENPPAPPAPKKKRGFWSKIFGRGHDEPDTPSEPDHPKKKSGGL